MAYQEGSVVETDQGIFTLKGGEWVSTVNVPEGQIQPPQPQPLKPSPLSGITDNRLSLESIVEPAATIASGIVAEPLAGLAGIAGLPFGAGPENIKSVREALTYQPRTPSGKKGLESLSRLLQPVGDILSGAEQSLGDIGFDVAGPIGGAIGKTLPTAGLMLLGAKPARQALKPKQSVNKLLTEASPSVDDLKTAARGIYDELDNSGAVVNSSRISKLGSDLSVLAKRQGIDDTLHPKSSAALRKITDIDADLTLTEVDTLRKVAKAAAESIDPSDARLGSLMVDKIDDFLDGLNPADFAAGKGKDIGSKFKEARALWGRAKRSEILDEAFSRAQNQASGFENGIRTQFRSLLNNKKKMRGFSPEERKLIEKVVRGGTAENIAKRLGKLGFGEGQATNMLMGSLGIAGGAAVFGTAGAVAVPLIGTVSAKLAQKMTKNNAALTNSVVRAGTDGKKITEAYIKYVPVKERSVAELTELLVRPGIALKRLKARENPSMSQKLSADAIYFASFIQSQKEDN